MIQKKKILAGTNPIICSKSVKSSLYSRWCFFQSKLALFIYYCCLKVVESKAQVVLKFPLN